MTAAVFGLPSRPHINGMRIHPHAEATYRVIPLQDGGFAVEVAIPNTYPTTVSRFATEAAADEWIAQKKKQVEAEGVAQKWFRRAGTW